MKSDTWLLFHLPTGVSLILKVELDFSRGKKNHKRNSSQVRIRDEGIY